MELGLNQISKKYGNFVAVNQVSTVITPGVWGLLGANGSGKTTLLRMLCGILKPDGGEVTLDGTPVLELDEAYRNILGYLPQDFGYYPDYSGEEFMEYIACIKGLPTQTARQRIKRLLGEVDLYDVRKKKIRQYSGGMKQRLGIAQAMLNNPQVLVLDEPTAGLDPKERVRFRNLISAFAEDRIVIVSTHIVSDVESAAECNLIMKKGEIILCGSTQQLLSQIEGKVWECSLLPKEALVQGQKAVIANRRNDGNRVILRILSEQCPAPNAMAVEPCLEDLYLWIFRDEAKDTPTLKNAKEV